MEVPDQSVLGKAVYTCEASCRNMDGEAAGGRLTAPVQSVLLLIALALEIEVLSLSSPLKTGINKISRGLLLSLPTGSCVICL